MLVYTVRKLKYRVRGFNWHFPRGMIMIIAISQSKLLQRAGLWIW